MHDIVGHDNILSFFDNVIQNGNLGHAYCFCGPGRVGKFTVAQELAARLLKTTRDKIQMHPDYIVVERIVDEKTEKLKKDISIEQVRSAISQLSQTSFLPGGYRVAIVDHAEFLSTAASNALLKTLEEPRGKTVIFLITQNEKELLGTIRSRCQLFYFSLVNQRKIASWLEKNVIEPDRAQELTEYCQGIPGKAWEWANDAESFEIYKQEINRFKGLLRKPFYEKLSIVEKLFGDKEDHIKARERLQDVLSIWQIELNQMAREGNSNLSDKTIISVSDDISKARKYLEENIHPRLLTEHILLQLP
ncbi:MAG: hypothetical protein WCW16_01235 [Candidatus Magasanikbacteria bacterium]